MDQLYFPFAEFFLALTKLAARRTRNPLVQEALLQGAHVALIARKLSLLQGACPSIS